MLEREREREREGGGGEGGIEREGGGVEVECMVKKGGRRKEWGLGRKPYNTEATECQFLYATDKYDSAFHGSNPRPPTLITCGSKHL